MSDIYFQCDCGKNLAVDEVGIGRTVNCTACNKPIAIPNPAIRFACTKCGAEMLTPKTMAGKEVQCVNCSAATTVPSSTKADDSIKFNCPNCHQHLEAPMDMVGVQLACPGCNQNLTVPVKSNDDQTASPPPLRKKAADLPAAIPMPSPLNKAAAIKPGIANGSGIVAPASIIDNKTKWMIIIALILGTLGLWIIGPLGAMLGIILGHISKVRLKHTANSRYKGLCQGSLAVSYIALILFVSIILVTHGDSGTLIALINKSDNKLDSQPLVYKTIQEAIEKRDLADVKRHLQRGADANARYDNGETALMLSLVKDDLDVVKLLVAKGADVNAKNKGGDTPLMGADHLAVVKFLVAKGADVNAKNNNGRTPLSDDVLSAMMQSGTHLNLAVDYLDVIKFLISKGADINAKDKDGWTPLMLAVEWGGLESNLEMVEFLVDNGADVNARDKDGNTPLAEASDLGNLDVVEFLKQHGAKEQTSDEKYAKSAKNYEDIHEAAIHGNLADVKRHLQKGADVKGAGKGFISTPLMGAISGGHLDMVKFLVSRGADVNAKDEDGQTLLYYAAYKGHLDVVQYLVLEKGADVNAGKGGVTPLRIAAFKNHLEVLEFLKQHGARK